MLKRLARSLITRLLVPPGSTATIFRGPLKGRRYTVDALSGWSHLYGGWEPDACEFYRRTVRQGMTVYDIGANTGMHTLLFSVLTGPGGRVYAFEPLPVNLDRIRDTLRLNDVLNVTIVDAAVSDTAGTAEFHQGPNNFQGSLIQQGGGSITVRTATLDDLIAGGYPPPDLIKMDIEGAESLALAGYEKSIEAHRPIMAIDLHTPEQDLKVGAFLQRHRYRIHRLRGPRERTARLLTEVRYADRPWPDPEGIWGTVIAYPA